MASNLVTNGLIRKRQELVAGLAAHDKVRDALVADIDAVDRAIVLCGQTKPKPVRMFATNQLRRMVGDIRRTNPAITKRAEIAAAVIYRMGWDVKDRKLFQLVRQKVKDCLNGARANARRTELRKARRSE